MENDIRVDLALVHYPVCNRNSEVIGSAVTNLDIHDIARAGRTFGVGTYYLVTPFADQQQLVNEIVDHWQTGHGSEYNKPRKEALSIVRVCSDLEELFTEVAGNRGARPIIVATSAARNAKTMEYVDARQKIFTGEPMLLLFGTGWGLAPEVTERIDAFLPPIVGGGDYNHLSVRSAASIILDRLLGDR
ncbi:MAG: RNA methyltransferase [Proteobacteria bacterium]|nr:RNA methyltransferase [Pseudomonadota bacterium]MBU1737355.1 RNA methyltransferase [Pseudomonadota bacterium]